MRNFGDDLSRHAVELATGRRAKWSSVDRAAIFGIGSILNLYLERGGSGTVWGTGLRIPPSSPQHLDPAKVLAVRGTWTRDLLGLGSDVQLGDPGLLARGLFARRPRSGVLVLPHFAVLGQKEGRDQLAKARRAGHEVVVPSETVETVCAKIASADHLLTSSLHGLVVGHALRTPTTLVRFGPTNEPNYKYDDYLSIFGLTSTFIQFDDLLATGLPPDTVTRAHQINEIVDPLVDQTIEGLTACAHQLVNG